MKIDSNESTAKTITEDEAALYDRQIRLWGIDAQKRLINSRVCLINMQGLGAEIAKNLVLSGINSLHIIDSNVVTEDDFNSNFLIDRKLLGENVRMKIFCLVSIN
jgi:ubiquitin-like 1-activating enzyme E1 A